MKQLARIIGSIIAGGILLELVLSHFGLRQTIASIHQASPNLLLLGVLLMIFSYLIRTARWRIWESFPADVPLIHAQADRSLSIRSEVQS
jgi:uncharacterized membrane protein YbhN (UPF0104 family)